MHFSRYIILIPLILFVLFKRGKGVVLAIKEKDNSKLKAELLFLGITIAIVVAMVMFTESLKN